MPKDSWRNRIVGHRDVPPGDLELNELNFREHSPHQRRVMRELLEESGWLHSVVFNRTTGRIINGAMRVKLARERGEASIPVTDVEITEAEELRALATFDPVGALATANRDVLDRLLGQVEADGAVEELLASVARSAGLPAGGTTAGLVDADEVPDRGDDFDQRTSAGQLWALGRHRLLCGDSADPATLRRLLGDERVQMTFLDAPYGVDYRPQRSAGGRPGAAPLQNDDLDAEAYEAWFMRVFAALDLAAGTTVYACHVDTMGEIVRRVFRRAGFHHAATLIWAKTHATLGRSDYGWEHEPILFGWRRSAAHRWHGGQKESTVWKFPRDRISGPGESGHPTVKPVSLVERAMLNSSLPEDSVLDPFIGSGTSLIAAERLGRRCFAVEIEHRFVDLAIARWEAFTGRSAELIDG